MSWVPLKSHLTILHKASAQRSEEDLLLRLFAHFNWLTLPLFMAHGLYSTTKERDFHRRNRIEQSSSFLAFFRDASLHPLLWGESGLSQGQTWIERPIKCWTTAPYYSLEQKHIGYQVNPWYLSQPDGCSHWLLGDYNPAADLKIKDADIFKVASLHCLLAGPDSNKNATNLGPTAEMAACSSSLKSNWLTGRKNSILTAASGGGQTSWCETLQHRPLI